MFRQVRARRGRQDGGVVEIVTKVTRKTSSVTGKVRALVTEGGVVPRRADIDTVPGRRHSRARLCENSRGRKCLKRGLQGGRSPAALRLFHKFRFQLHRANAVDFAVDIVVAADEADVFHLGTDFDYR